MINLFRSIIKESYDIVTEPEVFLCLFSVGFVILAHIGFTTLVYIIKDIQL